VNLLFITAKRVQVLVMNLKDEPKRLLELLKPPYAELIREAGGRGAERREKRKRACSQVFTRGA
jgi:hypothetical protein